MQLIVLAGLVSVEKRDLALDLVHFFEQEGEQVVLLDNIARLAITLDDAPQPIPLQRITGDSLAQLPDIIQRQSAQRVILAISENVNPADLFVTLDTISQQTPEIDIQTLALIDLRTCDCFPGVRQQLELYADHVLMLPYAWDEIRAIVKPTA